MIQTLWLIGVALLCCGGLIVYTIYSAAGEVIRRITVVERLLVDREVREQVEKGEAE